MLFLNRFPKQYPRIPCLVLEVCCFFFPVWVFQFGSKLKLENISSVGESVKPKSLFLICDCKNSQVLEVFPFPRCGKHPPQARVPRL